MTDGFNVADVATPFEVRSRDGTRIGGIALGSGPSVLVIPGALQAAADYLPLASGLAAKQTVYLLDRRGRGASGPQGDSYSIDRECEDVEAVLEHCGAERVFGHSYGGLVALHVARRRALVVAVYEPPVSFERSVPSDWVEPFERLLHKGDELGALVCLVRGGQFAAAAGYLPPRLFTLAASWFVPSAERRRAVALLPTIPAEMREVVRLDGQESAFDQIGSPVCLIAGTRSPGYFRYAIDRLAIAIPNTRIEVLQGLDHGSPTEGPPALTRALLAYFD